MQTAGLTDDDDKAEAAKADQVHVPDACVVREQHGAQDNAVRDNIRPCVQPRG